MSPVIAAYFKFRRAGMRPANAWNLAIVLTG